MPRKLHGGLDLRPDDALGQAELRDAVDQHAAGHVQRLEDRHLVAQLGQVDRAGQPRGAGADHGDLPAGSRGRRRGLEVLAQRVVAHVALQPADGDRLALLADDAYRLALRFLRADAAADGRQVVLDLHRLDRGEQIALAQRLDELRDLHADRAARRHRPAWRTAGSARPRPGRLPTCSPGPLPRSSQRAPPAPAPASRAAGFAYVLCSKAETCLFAPKVYC